MPHGSQLWLLEDIAAPLEAEPDPMNLGACRRRVLVVDDSASIRRAIATELTREGYDVAQAEDGNVALEVVTDDLPRLDLLITDIQMPELRGDDLAREVRERIPGVWVIYISASPAYAYLAAGRSRDTAFLQKPFALATLTRLVREMMGWRDQAQLDQTIETTLQQELELGVV